MLLLEQLPSGLAISQSRPPPEHFQSTGLLEASTRPPWACGVG